MDELNNEMCSDQFQMDMRQKIESLHNHEFLSSPGSALSHQTLSERTFTQSSISQNSLNSGKSSSTL